MDAVIRPNDLGGISVICPIHGWILTAPDRGTVEASAANHVGCAAEGNS